MILTEFPFAPKRLYERFGRYFPFATVDVVVFHNYSFILTKRTISLYKGLWHLPGGIIRKGEKIENAAIRVIKEELNLEARLEGFLGVYENPIRTRHDITHCFIARLSEGVSIQFSRANRHKFFKKIPNNTIPYHKVIIRDALRVVKV